MAVIFSSNAQTNDKTCHFGLTFEISNNPNWGYGEPVVLTVDANSPAEIAGIQPGDIIMEINGAATYLRNYQTIASWLFNTNSDVAVFTIRNLNTYFKEIELPRQCRSPKSVAEVDLATSFSMYSVENTQDRAFILPLKISTNKDVDYSDYHTFSFIEAPNAPEVDALVNAQIQKALTDRGLVLNNEDPDFLIQTFYSYQPNVKYRESSDVKEKETWRYNPITKEMVLIPFLSGDNRNADSDGRFVLEFGIRFFDKKLIDPENPTQMWEAQTKEYLTSDFSLEKYAEAHTSLIMMQFPYSTDKVMARYVVSFKKYNYTGMCFSMDDMKTISDVDRNSPAYNIGIRPGAVIEKIDDIKFKYTKDEILNGYKRFIVETMKLRNPNTQFTDANGYPDCMYWNSRFYNDIRKAFRKDIYVPVFSYIYSFEKYVTDKPNKTIVIEANVNGKNEKFTLTPNVRSSVSVRAF